MGPLPFGSGRASIDLRSCSRRRASMGPLPFGSGRSLRSRVCPRALVLQWGRSLSEAEGGIDDSADAEQHARFNGAAPFRKRKVADADRQSLLTVDASMGPLPFGSGRRPDSPMSGRTCAVASMGPLPFGSGRQREFHHARSGKRCGLQWGRSLSEAEGFNYLPRRIGRISASMGPLPFGSGRCGKQLGSNSGMRASMGPLPFGSGRAS